MTKTTKGGIIEKREIGISIGTSGTHHNTYFDEVEGVIKLKIVEHNEDGEPIYAEEGYWISDVINMEDKFKEYDKIFTTHSDSGSSNIVVQTRTSDNGNQWSEWVPIAYDGKIQSETKQYIQIKIIFYAGFVNEIRLVKNELYNNKYADITDGIKLKREYEFDMELDESWNDEGNLHRKVVSRSEWVRVDRLNVVEKVVK